MTNTTTQPALDVGETLTVVRETDSDHSSYPNTIVGGLVIDIDTDDYHTIWYYNDRGEVVAGRHLSQARVVSNLDANDGDWSILVSDEAHEDHGYIQLFMDDPDTDVDAALDIIEDDLDIQRDSHQWAIGPRSHGRGTPDKLYEGTWREAQEYCRRAEDNLEVYGRVEPVTDG